MSDQFRSSSRSYLPATLSIVAVAVLRLLPLAFPEARLWGLDFFLYLDPSVIVASTLLLLVFALPWTQRRIASLMEKQGERFWNSRLKMLAGVLLLLVVLFPMRTFFYGDGGTLITEVYKIGAQENYSSSILLNFKSAPLTGLLLHAIALAVPAGMHAIGLARPGSVMFPWYMLSMLGVLVLYALVFLQRDKRDRLLAFALLIGSGSAVFFFSHAEMYLPVTISIAAFLLAGQRALRGEFSLVVLTLLFVISVLAHYMALALLPALLFVLFRNRDVAKLLAGSGRALLLTWVASIGVIALLYWLLGFASSDSRVIMPLYDVQTEAGTLSYTLLSAEHLLDLGNLLLLFAAVPLLFVIAAPLFARGQGTNTEQRFLLIALLYFGTFIFFANTSLGLARDWDIAAPLGIIIVLLVPHALAVLPEEVRRHVTAVVAFAAMASVLPWILVNVNDASAARRFESVMQLDADRMYGDYALSGYESLRKYYLHEKQLDEEARILRSMVDVVGYAEQYRLLLVNAFTRFQLDPNTSMSTQFWVMDRLQRTADGLILSSKDRNYAISRWEIDSLYGAVAAEAITNATMKAVFPPIQNMTQRAGLRLGYDILLGTGWYLDERFAEAAEQLRHAWESSFRDPRVDGMYASALTLAGMPDVGDAVFTEAARWHSKSPRFLLAYATTQIQLQRNAGQAKSALLAALEGNTHQPTIDELNSMLALLGDVPPAPLPWSVQQPQLGQR